MSNPIDFALRRSRGRYTSKTLSQAEDMTNTAQAAPAAPAVPARVQSGGFTSKTLSGLTASAPGSTPAPSVAPAAGTGRGLTSKTLTGAFGESTATPTGQETEDGTAALRRQLEQLEARRTELTAGLDLEGAASLDGEIASLKKQLGLTFPQQAVKTISGIVKAAPAGLEGTVGSMANAWTALYQAGQSGRDAQNREYLEEYSAGLTRAKRDMEVMLAENRDKPGSWSDRDIQSQQYIIDDWQRKYDAMAKVAGEDIQQKAAKASYDLADDISGDSAQRIEEAKDGLLLPGQIFVDATASTIQNLGDLAVNTLLSTPGSMGSFAMRAFGGGAQQARQDMEVMGTADQEDAYARQTLYGLASTAKEIFTEKMFGLSLPFGAAYGKGGLDELAGNAIERAVSRFAGTSAGKRMLEGGLNLASGAASEGLEELIGDWMEWQLPRIYGGEADSAAETLENSLYDFLVGAASGGLGDVTFRSANSAANAVTGNTAGRTGAQFRAMGDDVVQAIIDEGLASGEGTISHTLAQEMQSQLDRGEAVRDRDVGRLYQANVEAIDAEGESDRLLSQAAREATETGRTTNRTAAQILADEAARATLETDEGLAITEDMTRSQQRTAVKDAVGRLVSREAATQEQGAGVTSPQNQGAQTRTWSAAERVLSVKQLDAALNTLGAQGRKQGRAFFDAETQDPVSYYGGFAAYYEAGVSGMDMDKVHSQYAGALNDVQRQAAYLAGQTDAAASLRAEQGRVATATVYGKETGLVPSDAAASLPRSTVSYLNDLGRAAGVKIQMAPATGSGGANGWYVNGIVNIAADAEDPGIVVATHEITHRMQEMAPRAYRAYRDYAMKLMDSGAGAHSMVEAYKARYADKVHQNLTTEQAMDEIAADFTAELLQNVEGFKDLARENRSVARKLLDAVRDFIRRVKSFFKGNKAAQDSAATSAYGVRMDELEEAARLWGEALEATRAQVQTQKNTAARQDGEARYSIKNTRNMTLAEQLKALYAGKLRPSDALYFGETPKTLSAVGLDNLPLALTTSDFRKSAKGKHNVPRRVWNNLLNTLQNPIFAFQDGDRIGILTSDIDGDGKPLLVAVERNVTMDRTPVNAIRSVYGLDNPDQWMKNQFGRGKKYIPMDKIRANAFLQTHGAYLAAVGVDIRSDGEILPRPHQTVNPSSEGKTRFSLKATEEEQRSELSDVNTRFSLRKKDPPKKAGIAYKVFLAKDGQLYPPMVANPGGAGTPVGVWLDADIGQSAPPSKTGRAQVQGGGKGTAAGKISLAFRPGWHLGDIPLAKQFARKNPATGVKDLFPADFVWAECEYAMDVDYQEEAMSYGYTENGKFRHSYAGLPKLPTDGYYKYRTNPNPDTVPWIITGAMRVKRILTDAETDAICREAGVEPMQRQGGPIDLSKYGLEAGDTAEQPRFSLKEYSEAEKKEHAKTALEHFGRTFYWKETGYLTQDGKKIDFSGRHDGAPGGYRTVDHRDISDALGLGYGGEDYSGAMTQFMAEGNIRISPESNGINLSVMPTKAQMEALDDFISKARGEVILDIDAPGGDTVSSTEYPKGTRASKVLADISRYFETGETPYVSETARFRFSLKQSRSIQEELYAIRQQNEELKARLDEYKGAAREAERQKGRADYWQGQTRRTGRATTDAKAVKAATQSLIRDTYSTADLQEIQNDLQSLYDYIAGGDEVSGGEVWSRARDIAQTLVLNAEAEDTQYDELLSYLRSAKLNIGREFNDIQDFGDFRKRYFGKLHIGTQGTNIDQVYQELSNLWPEFFDEQAHSHPSDQLEHIAEVYDQLADSRRSNPFSAYTQEAINGTANEIMELFFDLPQTKATMADRWAAKVDEAKASGRRQVQRVREQYNARTERLREQNRERVQRAIDQERAVRDRQIQRLKDHYAQVQESRAERRADSAARSRLLKIARRLQNKKLPAVNRALLDQYIGDLDTTAKSMTGQTLERLSGLKEWYVEQKENDPDFIADPAIEKELERLSKRHIGDMTAEEVADLTRILLHIENELRTKRQLIDSEDRRDIYLQGVQAINDVENSGGSREGGVMGVIDKYIVTETLSPLRQIKRMAGYVKSDPLIILTNALADGQREALSYQMEAERPFRKWAENKKFNRTFSGAEAQSITIAGLASGKGVTSVEITPAMRASLYLHSLNGQNLRHIRDGGITVPDMKLYRKGKIAEAYARGTTIKLTPSQVRSITSSMSQEEKAFARAVHDYFNGQSRDRINEVSEKLKGYSIAQVEDYFPINTDTSFTKSDFETLKFDGTIEGMGFLKDRQVKASNPIYLRDINDVLQKSIDQHSRYVGLAIPVRNFNKVWGVTKSSFNDDGSRNGYEGSVQKAVKNAWGETGYNYVEKMMTDLQGGGNQKNVWTKALNRIRSNYAGAVLTLNASVAMKQAASYPTAAAVLGWGPLTRAMADMGKVDLDLIAKYTPLQWYRSKGFSTKELGDMKQAGGPIAKVMNSLPPVLNWVQGADLLTTRKLWKAAEYYVRANNKELHQGTDAYYRAVAEVYNRVIEETQPNYTTMQRPQLLRSDDSLLGNLAMFKTQPFQNFNILYDAVGEYIAAERNGADVRTARKNLRNAITSQLAQLAVFASMTMAWALFRGRREKYEDEEGEMSLRSVLTALGKDMVGGQLSTVPFGSDLWELVSSKLFGDRYYGMDAVTVTAISDTISSMNGMGELIGSTLKSVSSDDAVNWNSVRIKTDSYLDDISKAAGVPYENVVNLFNAIYRHICIATLGKYQGEYAALKLTADPEKKSGTYYDLLYKAMVNSRSEYQAIYQDMVESGFSPEKVSGAMEARMKNAQGVGSVSDLEQRFLSPAQEQVYSGLQQQLSGTSIWRSATAEQRDAAEDDIYNIVVGNGTGEKLREKIDGGAAYGIDEADYILYRLALHVVDQPSESGKLGSFTMEEVEAAIDMLPGLSDAARGYLWEAHGKSEQSNPYK